jgi:hypothetical protein
MPDYRSRLLNEALRTVAIAATYTNLGVPLVYPSRIMKIENESNAAITVSFDGGVTDHERIPATSFVLIDATSNAVAESNLARAAGTQISVKGAGTGNIYLSTYYAA